MDQDTLKRLLDYDQKTGLFTWKIRSQNTKSNNIFNSLFAGKVAGSILTSKRSRTKYIAITFSNNGARKTYKAHRLAFLYMVGSIPEQVDHIDHDGTNNKWENLRSSDSRDNSRNLPMQKSNKTGVIGVNWHKAANKWQVRAVDKSGKRIDLGRYSDFDEAVEVRKKYEIEFGYFEHREKR